MKNSIINGSILVLLLTAASLRSDAQAIYTEVTMNKQLSQQDSVRLVHYLVGYGIMQGKGEFANDRKVYIDSALQVVPWSALLWFDKSFDLLFAHKFEIGMPYLDSAVKYDRKGYIGYRGYMKCIFQKHHLEAIQDLKTAQELLGEGHIEDHSYNFFIGLCYLQLNKFDSAEYLFTNTINNVRAQYGSAVIHYLDWFYRGIALFEKNEYAQAGTCFDSSIKIYPDFSDAKFYRSWCFSLQQEDKAALDQIRDANIDFQAGYTINEDNARYEPYPYQVNRYMLRETLEIMSKKNKIPQPK